MIKHVVDTKAGQSISAFLIFKNGDLVGKVQAHYGNKGRVMVNVWNYGKGHEKMGTFQHGAAGGYGYDKLTAALSGIVIDGIELLDHCQKKDNDGNYITAGLDLLCKLGYDVHQAI